MRNVAIIIVGLVLSLTVTAQAVLKGEWQSKTDAYKIGYVEGMHDTLWLVALYTTPSDPRHWTNDQIFQFSTAMLKCLAGQYSGDTIAIANGAVAGAATNDSLGKPNDVTKDIMDAFVACGKKQ